MAKGEKVKIYNRFNPPPAPGVECSAEEDKTHQEFQEECDINAIMRRYLTTGVFPPNTKVGRYGDFSEVGEYQEALERVKTARAQFAALPAKVRDRFGNEPARFLAWLPTASLEEANALGLLSEEASSRLAAKPPPEVKPPA